MLVMVFFLQCSLPKHLHKTPKKVVLSLRISQTQFSPNLFPSCYLSLVVVCTPLFGTLPVCLFDDCNKIWYISKKYCAHVIVSGGRGGFRKIYIEKKLWSIIRQLSFHTYKCLLILQGVEINQTLIFASHSKQ